MLKDTSEFLKSKNVSYKSEIDSVRKSDAGKVFMDLTSNGEVSVYLMSQLRTHSK